MIVIAFHAIWIPIVITILLVGLPASLFLMEHKLPMIGFAAAAFTVMGLLISLVVWICYAIWR